MGILSVLEYMENSDFTCRQFDIRQFVKQKQGLIITVDGNMFISWYALKNFQWIIGGVIEYAENIRDFVKAFRKLNIRLIFFFQDEMMCPLNQEKWKRYRKGSKYCARRILMKILYKVPMVTIEDSMNSNLHKPLDVHFLTISILREMNCEVICLAKDRVKSIALYAQANECLAIMSQTSYFVFFRHIRPAILSLKHFDINSMTTKLYCRDALTLRLRIYKKSVPLFATLLGNAQECNLPERRNILQTIRQNSDKKTGPWCVIVATFIRQTFQTSSTDDVSSFLKQYFPENSKMLIRSYWKNDSFFNLHSEDWDNFIPDTAQLTTWEKIILKCKEYHKCGKFSSVILSIMEGQTYEQCPVLEDFEEIPPCSQVYRALRQNLYAILLHDAVPLAEDITVQEWCMEGEHTTDLPYIVSPARIDPDLHPGLLTLWNPDLSLSETKWRLFGLSVSRSLDYRQLSILRPTLILPVAVLYYLFYEMPRYFGSVLLKPWEMELFLVTAIVLPSTDIGYLKYTRVHTGNLRAIRLAVLFMHGCDIMKCVVQACGLVLEESNLSIWNFFDGKLFHCLYEKSVSGEIILDPGAAWFNEFDFVRKAIFRCQTRIVNLYVH